MDRSAAERATSIKTGSSLILHDARRTTYGEEGLTDNVQEAPSLKYPAAEPETTDLEESWKALCRLHTQIASARYWAYVPCNEDTAHFL